MLFGSFPATAELAMMEEGDFRERVSATFAATFGELDLSPPFSAAAGISASPGDPPSNFRPFKAEQVCLVGCAHDGGWVFIHYPLIRRHQHPVVPHPLPHLPCHPEGGRKGSGAGRTIAQRV